MTILSSTFGGASRENDDSDALFLRLFSPKRELRRRFLQDAADFLCDREWGYLFF
jgi:hypothetical protein